MLVGEVRHLRTTTASVTTALARRGNVRAPNEAGEGNQASECVPFCPHEAGGHKIMDPHQHNTLRYRSMCACAPLLTHPVNMSAIVVTGGSQTKAHEQKHPRPQQPGETIMEQPWNNPAATCAGVIMFGHEGVCLTTMSSSGCAALACRISPSSPRTQSL